MIIYDGSQGSKYVTYTYTSENRYNLDVYGLLNDQMKTNRTSLRTQKRFLCFNKF